MFLYNLGTIFPSFLINKSFWNTAKKCMEMLILDKKIRFGY